MFLLFYCAKKTPDFSLRALSPLQSSRVLEGIVIMGLGSVGVVLLPLFAVFINFYNLFKTLHLNHTSIDYVTYYSSYVTVIFRSQLFNLCSEDVCSQLTVHSFHTTPVIILGDFGKYVLDPDNPQAPCFLN